MSKWTELYQQKLTTPEGIAKQINSGDACVSNGQVAEPIAILEALAKRAVEEDLKGIEHSILLPLRKQPYLTPEMSERIHHNSLFNSGCNRDLIWDGYADYIPTFYGEVALNLEKRGKVDVWYAAVSPMDKHGYLSFGTAADLGEVRYRADKIFVEVNPTMPRVHGHCFIHISQVTALCETNVPITEVPSPEITEIDKTIGEFIAERIDDGACIQLGIGGMPNAVAQALMSRKELGVHSEMFVESMVDLIEAGVITNHRKTLHPDKCICTFTFGPRRVYDFLDDNPCVEFHPVSYTNNPCIVALNDNQISINSCLEVDLFGQACSESIGPKNYSGVGGQLDFVRGAMRSKGGKSFLATASTAKNGTISKITSVMKGIVTTGRNDIDHLVTEFGVAELRGKTCQERAKAIIAIAHPNFREQLFKEAQELHIIPKTVSVAVNK